MGFRTYRREIRTNWLTKLDETKTTRHRWPDIYHLVIIANSKETWPILEATVEALKASTYPLERILVVLATEARCGEVGVTNGERLKQQYGQTFGGVFVTVHPADLPDEIIGKGANISYSAETIVPELVKRQLDFTNILVTTLDADNRVHPVYFAALTWTFLTAPRPHLMSYQPLPMYFNHIWAVPMIVRSISVGSLQMISDAPHRWNFRFRACLLLKSKFWSKTTIVEDGHQYWRSFFATNGEHTVAPIFVPIYQDAVHSPDGHLMTYQEQYIQKRRWAWGVSDVPFVLTQMWARRHQLPRSSWLQALRLIEGHTTWAVTSLVLAIFGWLPMLINQTFRTTVFAFHFAADYQHLLQFAMGGMVITIVISRLLLPPRPRFRLHSNDLVEWILAPILLPLANILFGSLAAIDAQTRLALGKYLEFRPTAKAVERQALPTTN